MIEKVSSSKVYTPNWENKKQPSFNGLGEFMLQAVQACERNPMLNVSVVDLATAIVPRTIIETKESNAFAGFEAARRESSGLLVNCLTPGFIVMGLAWLLQRPIMKGFGDAKMHKVLANEESLKLIQKYLGNAKGEGSVKLENALTAFLNDLSGVDGKEIKAFAKFDLQSGIKKIAKSSDISPKRLKKPEKLFKRGYQDIAQATHMTEHLKLKGQNKFLSKNLKGFLEDFVKVSQVVEKKGIKSSLQWTYFIKKAIKLVNWKSFAGLGVIIPLAISMQPLNRWITQKTSGIKGAPIYKDFTENNHVELTPKEKKDLLKQKFISVGSMIGVMLLSMGKFPGKEAFQFKGAFPTMDQARLISTATFSSRMMSAEDKNELREATIRDIATYSGLYFLGDYAAKAIATITQKIKPEIKLLNELKELPKDANIFKKFAHWAKDVTLKSSDEVIGKAARNMRSVCQLGNLAFSLVALGVFIPLYTRTQTNKKRELELKQLAASVNSTNGFLKDQITNGSPAFKSFSLR